MKQNADDVTNPPAQRRQKPNGSVQQTEWGVELGVTKVPEPELFTYPERGLYGWQIDRHGLFVFATSAEKCRENFRAAYFSETGQTIPECEDLNIPVQYLLEI